MADESTPRFRDLREITDTPFECPTHGEVHQVLQFNDELARSYCAACVEDHLVASGVQLVEMVSG